MKISSANIMALRSDLHFIRGYLRELETRKRTWKTWITRILRAEDADYKIDKVQALVHIFSKTLEVARKVNRYEENEDELFFSLLDLCESVKDEIAVQKTHDPKFIQVIMDLDSRFEDDGWIQISSYVDRVRELKAIEKEL